MKTTLYTLVIEDNVPTIKPLESVGTMQLNGQTYWLVPMTITQGAPPEVAPLAAASLSEPEQIVDYVARHPHFSIAQIAKAMRTSPYLVRQAMKAANLQTPLQRATEKVIEAMVEAGTAGLESTDLTPFAQEEHMSLGPILAQLKKLGTITKRFDGKWVIT